MISAKNIILTSKKDNYLNSYIKKYKEFVDINFLYIEDECDSKKLVEKLKKFNTIYFVNFHDYYRKILPYIPFKIRCNSIISYEIGEFTNPNILYEYNSIVEFYDRLIFKEIFTISFELYNVLKNSKYNVKYIDVSFNYDIHKNIKYNNVIGVISSDYNPNNNFYNILSALTMTNATEIKLISHMPATKEFISRFNLPVKFCNNIDDVISDSTLNIYSNFTANNYELLYRSLDQNIPCIIGNIDSNILKKYNKNLILTSDDNVDELAQIINNFLN